MPNLASEVVVGKPLASGGILSGPLTAVLPTDATSAPDPSLVANGYVDADGVTESVNTSSSDIKAWGGDTVRTVQTEHTLEYKFKLLQSDAQNLALYYGDENVALGAVPNSFIARIRAGDLPHHKWVIEVKDGDARIRVCIPDGQITDRGDITYKDSEAIEYEVTVTCYPDSTGTKAYKYIDLPAAA